MAVPKVATFERKHQNLLVLGISCLKQCCANSTHCYAFLPLLFKGMVWRGNSWQHCAHQTGAERPGKAEGVLQGSIACSCACVFETPCYMEPHGCSRHGWVFDEQLNLISSFPLMNNRGNEEHVEGSLATDLREQTSICLWQWTTQRARKVLRAVPQLHLSKEPEIHLFVFYRFKL